MGRLTRDPELREGRSGARFAVFTVAVNRRWKDNGNPREETAFVPCILFGPPADWMVGHRKGEALMVSGRLRTELWEADGTTHSRLVLVVSELQFVRLVFKPELSSQPPPEELVADEIPF